MKKLCIISLVALAGAIIIGSSDVRRKPGRIYMPDMIYSRAYETYSVTEEQKAALEKKGIYFSNVPVEGTIKRGARFPFVIPKDKDAADSTNYVASKQVKNPLPALDSGQAVEAERLYLVN